MASLSSVLTALAGPIVKKALTSIGVGVVTFAGVSTAVQAGLDYAKSNFSGMIADVAQVVAMSGIFTAFGIIAGGLMAGVSMLILNRFAKLT